MRHQTAFAHAIAEEVGAPAEDVACAALETRDLTHQRANPEHALKEVFDLLESGWTATLPAADTGDRQAERPRSGAAPTSPETHSAGNAR